PRRHGTSRSRSWRCATVDSSPRDGARDGRVIRRVVRRPRIPRRSTPLTMHGPLDVAGLAVRRPLFWVAARRRYLLRRRVSARAASSAAQGQTVPSVVDGAAARPKPLVATTFRPALTDVAARRRGVVAGAGIAAELPMAAPAGLGWLGPAASGPAFPGSAFPGPVSPGPGVTGARATGAATTGAGLPGAAATGSAFPGAAGPGAVATGPAVR